MDLFSMDSLINLVTLSGLEIILGIDNVIFIALLVQPLEPNLRNRTRIFGLTLALCARVIMLMGATWIMQLTEPLFSMFNLEVSGRDLLLFLGGLFLVVKSILEIKEMFANNHNEKADKQTKEKRYWKIIAQIVFIDILLSFDSVIAAVGLSNNIYIMVSAVVIAMIIMLISANFVGKFIYNNPSIKVLALAFIGFLGAILVLESININTDKTYLYFSMFFAGIAETININLRKRNLH